MPGGYTTTGSTGCQICLIYTGLASACAQQGHLYITYAAIRIPCVPTHAGFIVRLPDEITRRRPGLVVRIAEMPVFHEYVATLPD
jgi:hypothetical protein